MNRVLAATGLTALALVATLGAHHAYSVELGQPAGTTAGAVAAMLESEGYVVKEIEIETEDGEIEAEVTLEGAEYEITISLETGLVTEIEEEDGDDD